MALFNVIRILLLPIFNLPETVDKIQWFILPFPHYCLANSLYNLNQFKTFSKAKHMLYEQLPSILTSYLAENLTATLEILNIPIPMSLENLTQLLSYVNKTDFSKYTFPIQLFPSNGLIPIHPSGTYYVKGSSF